MKDRHTRRPAHERKRCAEFDKLAFSPNHGLASGPAGSCSTVKRWLGVGSKRHIIKHMWANVKFHGDRDDG